MNEPLSLDTRVEETPDPISLDTPTNSVDILSPSVIEKRAFRATYGMPAAQKSYDQVYQDIAAGRENALRTEMANELAFQKQLRSQRIINEVARKTGTGLTPQDVQTINNQIEAANRPPDPNNVIEEEYAKKHMSQLDTVSFMHDSVLTEARKQAPQLTEDQLVAGNVVKAKQEDIIRHLENMEAAKQSQGYTSWALDNALIFSQVYQEARLRGQVKGSGILEGGFLGSNLEAQSIRLLSLPYSEMKVELARIVGELKTNPTLAISFLNAMLGQSRSEEFLQNIFTPLMATGLVTGAKIAKGVKASREVSKQLDNALKSVLKDETAPTKAAIQESVGDTKEAAITAATGRIERQMKGVSDPVVDTKESMVALFSSEAKAIGANPGSFSKDFVNRLEEAYMAPIRGFANKLSEIMKVERIPGVLKIEEALRRVEREIIDEHPGMKNNQIAVSTPYKDDFADVYYVDVHFGQQGGKLWNFKDAKQFNNDHGLNGTLEQKGLRWTVKVTQPFKETGDAVRDFLIHTNENKTPKSMLNAFAGSLRTPEETMSLAQRRNRKIATYTQSKVFESLQEMAKEVDKLKGFRLPFTSNKKKWDQWEHAIDEIRTSYRDPRTGEVSLPRSVGVFADEFNRIRGRLPDEQEVKAYFTYKRAREVEQALNTRQQFKDWSREGAQTWTISTVLNPNSTSSPFVRKSIQATKLVQWPKDGDSMLVVGKNFTDEVVKDSSRYRSTKAGKQAIEDVASGKLTLLKVVNPDDYPLEGFGRTGGSRVRYILTPRAESRPMSWSDIKVKQFADTDFDHYVKQAHMRLDDVTGSWWYRGDRTVAAFNIRAKGKDVANKLNEVRKHIKNGDFDAARAANPLPLDFEEVHGWFKPGLTTEGLTIPSKLSLEDEIRLVPRLTRLHDLDRGLNEKYGKAFRDGTKEAYGGPIDNTPLYKSEPTRFVSPITLINRGLKRAVESQFMNDYKIFSAEHWVEEAAKYLDVDPKTLRESPMYYFYNPVWKEGADPVHDLATINNLKTVRFQVQQFLGVQDQTQTFLHSMAQKMTDWIYDKGFTRTALAPSHILPKLRDPFGFIRAVTFHDKIGLWAIPQLFVQTQTFSAIFGIAGAKYASTGTKAVMLDLYARVNRNPEILDHLDKLATKGLIPGAAKFKPGEFKEAWLALERTGFGNVGGEYIMRDSPQFYDVFSNKGKTFLDAATFFFKEGERFVRKGAWYTAYLEHRAKNPTGRLTDVDIADILNRADDLSLNMSRASASELHRGIFSIPTQFYSYALRMAELFWGKRLTKIEKGRLLAVNAALYGVPSAIGVTGFPVADYWQQKARENGYIMGENWYKTAFMEGGISTMLSTLTGNDYNASERYSNQGFEFLREALRSDQAVLSVVTGASGSTLYNTFLAMDPFFKAIASMTKQEGSFKLKPAHFLDIFKEISSVNNTWKLYMALNTGKWLTKNEGQISDVTASNALFMYLSGLSPQDSVELHLQHSTRKDEKAMTDWGFKQAIKEFRRGLNSYDNPQAADDFFKNAIAYLESVGYPIEDYDKFYSIAMRDYETLPDKMNWDYFNKDVPEHRKDIAQDAYGRLLRLKEQKK